MSEISEMVTKKLQELSAKYVLSDFEKNDVAEVLLAMSELNTRQKAVINEFFEWGAKNFGDEIPLE